MHATVMLVSPFPVFQKIPQVYGLDTQVTSGLTGDLPGASQAEAPAMPSQPSSPALSTCWP